MKEIKTHNCEICGLPTTNRKICDLCLENNEDIHLGYSKTRRDIYDVYIGYNKYFIIVYNHHSGRFSIANVADISPEEVCATIKLLRPKDRVADPVYFSKTVIPFERYKKTAERILNAKL